MACKRSDEERFLAKVDKNGPLYKGTPCWLWTAGKSNLGYGAFSFKSKMTYAHVWLYTFANGSIPDGKQVNHRCRHRHCVNPDHLYAGAQQENMLDKIKDGTDSGGEKNAMAKLNDDLVRKIRADSRPLTEIAAEFGISYPNVWMVKNYRTWKHVGEKRAEQEETGLMENEPEFDATIDAIDLSLSRMMTYHDHVKEGVLSERSRQRLKHYAENIIATGEALLRTLSYRN